MPNTHKNAHFNIEFAFYTDVDLPKMHHARVIRSPLRNGILQSVSHPDLPEGYALYTAKDVPGSNTVRTFNIETEIFASSRISYLGEPIGIIVGPDAATVDALLETLSIDIAPCPAAYSADSGKKPFAERVVIAGDADRLYDESELKTSGMYSIDLKPVLSSEPAGCIVACTSGILNVYVPAQWMSHLYKTLSAALKISGDEIRVKKMRTTDTGVNSLWYTSIITAQTAVAAKLSGKTVKLTYSRQEQLEYIEKSASAVILHKTGFNSSGKINAMLISIFVNTGYNNPFAAAIIDRLAVTAAGAYCPQSVRIEARTYSTHTPPRSAYLPWIEHHAFFAVENHLQKIAATARILPTEIRKLNSAGHADPKNVFPFSFGMEKTDAVIDGVSDAVIDAVQKMSDFNRRHTVYALNEQSREAGYDQPLPIRGIGLATAFGAGTFWDEVLAFGDPKMEVSLEKDGRVIISASQPSETVREIWIKIAAEILEVPHEQIEVQSIQASESESFLFAPDRNFSGIGTMTQLLQKCCQAIKKQRSTKALPIKIKRSITQDAAFKKWDAQRFQGMPFDAVAYAAAVIEVELDPYTLRDRIRGIWMVLDGGKILAQKKAESVIKQTVRDALSSLVVGESLKPEKITISFLQNSGEAKRLDNIAYTIIPAAYAAALSQALSSEIASLPVETDSMFRLQNRIIPRKRKRNMKIPITINDEKIMLDDEPDTRLLDILRKSNPKGVKCGCGQGLCGSCIILLDGVLVPSCLIPIAAVRGCEVITVDHISKTPIYSDIMHGFTQAGVQLCGYCDAGKILTAYHLISSKAAIDRKEIASMMAQLKCNCVDVDSLVNAVLYAASRRQRLEADKNAKRS